MRIAPYDFRPIHLQGCVLAGGSGFAIELGEQVELLFDPGKLSVTAHGGALDTILYPEILELQVSGPGTVTTGGGFIGGGFGVESAVEGIAVATVLNLLTTRSKTHTYISVSSLRGDLHFHYSGMEPGAVSIALSPVRMAIRRLNGRWIQNELERLEWCKEAGLITEDELARLRQNLLAPPSASQLAAEVAARKEAQIANEAKRWLSKTTGQATPSREVPGQPTPGKQVDITFFGKKL